MDTAHAKAIVTFFTPVISFNLGRFSENFTLYRIPENKGKRRTGKVWAFIKKLRITESIKEETSENLKTGLILPIMFILSGILIASSFRSVNLFNPYMLNVIKKVNIAVFVENLLINKSEERTLKEPLSAKKSDVEIKNDMSLSHNKKNFDNVSDILYRLKGFLCTIFWIVSTNASVIKYRIALVQLTSTMPFILAYKGLYFQQNCLK